MEENIELLLEAYEKAVNEHKTNPDKNYWQGRKDGIRIALSLFHSDKKTWELLNKTSPEFQDTERDRYKGMLRSIYYDVCDLVNSIRTKRQVHQMTIGNILSWVGVYDQLAIDGFTTKIDDAIDPFEKE